MLPKKPRFYTQLKASTSMKKQKTVLDILLLLILFGIMSIVGIFVLTFIMCAGGPVGCGDIALVALLPITGVGILSIVYMFASLASLIQKLIRHETTSKKHLIATIIIALLCFTPNVGPFWLAITSWQQNNELTNSMNDYKKNGPSAEKIAAIKMGSFEDFKSLLDECKIAVIDYDRYDFRGDYDSKNTYIAISTRNNITAENDTFSARINLPISDRSRVEDAANKSNATPSDRYPACSHKIIVSYPGAG